jgi:hypothetical protein
MVEEGEASNLGVACWSLEYSKELEMRVPKFFKRDKV